MSKTKATEAALFIGENEEILFLAFLGRLFRLCRWSFLLVWCRIELVCDEDDAVVLGALLINPLVWLEVALDGEQGSLLQLVERINMLVLAPCLKVHKGGNAVGFLAVLLQSAYCQRKTGYTGVGELTDFCIFTYESGYCEIVFNLFHNELLLEVFNQFYAASKSRCRKGMHQG